jgi:hypothetical protein
MYPLNNPLIDNLSYLVYLTISIGMTVWVARVLSRSGEVFLTRCFGHDQELAASTIGFYLVNIGFICMRLNAWPAEQIELIPALGSRIGSSILVLGVMHFTNMLLIARFGRTVSGWMHTYGPLEPETPATPPPLPKTY